MPICFDKEHNAWSLKDITQEETDALIELGKTDLLNKIGGTIMMKIFKSQMESGGEMEALANMPSEHMGQS